MSCLYLARGRQRKNSLNAGFISEGRPFYPHSFSFFPHSEVFPETPVDEFHQSVKRRVSTDLDGLVAEAVLKTKQLLRLGLKEKNDVDSTLLREGYAQAERLTSGVPLERFTKIARKEIRHKL